jgi:hypothetical protein
MKTYVTFTSSDPNELRPYLDGPDWKRVVSAILDNLRSKIKYGEKSEEAQLELEEVRKHVFQTIEDLGLSLDDL